MPTTQQILDSLTRAANGGIAVATLWHALAAVAIVALAFGWSPSNRLTNILLAAPIASVSLTSWISDSPFNGSLFGLLASALALIGVLYGDRRPVQLGPRWSRFVGGAMIAFGWLYPHFGVFTSGRPR